MLNLAAYTAKLTQKFRDWGPFLAAAAPCLLACLLYTNSLHNQLIWDDAIYVGADPFIRQPKNLFVVLNPANLWYVLPVSNSSRPIWLASAIMDLSASGGEFAPMRMTNLLINGFNASLVYCAALLISASPMAALASALLFAAHPLHTKNVNIISFRTHMLALAFLLAGFIFRQLARQQDRRSTTVICNAIALFSLLLSMLSHEIGVVGLPILVAYELLNRKNAPQIQPATQQQPPQPPQPSAKTPIGWLLLLALLLSFFTIYRLPRAGYDIGPVKDTLTPLSDTMKKHGIMPPTPTPLDVDTVRSQIVPPGLPPWHAVYESRYSNFLTMSRIFGEYLLKMVLPYPLQGDYSPRISSSLADWRIWFSWAGWIALGTLCWRFRASSPLIPAGFVWLAISMLPMSNIIRLYNIEAERYLYLPSAGFCMMCGGFLHAWASRLRRPAAVTTAILIPILLAWGAVTIARNRDYKDARAFFSSIIRQDAQVGRALTNLAHYHIGRQEYPEARKLLAQAITVYPQGSEARTTLADMNVALKDYPSALETLQPLMTKGGDLSQKARHLHAIIMGETGKTSEAVKELCDALDLWPDSVPLLTSLAFYSIKQREPEIFLRKLAKTDKRHTSESVKCYGAMAYFQTGQPNEAKAMLGFMTEEKRSACLSKIRQGTVQP
ncbi:MAG: tetratricopeptide repeat protein [Elusimicrobia bacterium]|nr:tetratricopeptide repeat protein [Elusimicrobiota bacterium]